jgi:ubiquinone biosynthesis protein
VTAELRKNNFFSYRHIGRYGEIAGVLVRYGFGDLLSRIKIERYFRFGKRKYAALESDVSAASHWDRVRMALAALGPAFVKLGQFASNRPDFLPPDLIASLEKLQDAVPPFSESRAVAIIEQELGRKIDELFTKFNRMPFASASMAQVHRAQLRDGADVAVKVQRPDIADTITIDCEIMMHIATLMEKHIQGMSAIQPRKLVEEFSNAIRKEQDFTIEAMHIERFADNFKDDHTVHIPVVYKSYSSRRVITSEFIDGIKVTNIKDVIASGGDPREIARRGAAAVLRQIFVHGFFHADPHAGNILIRKDNEVCFIDLGMTGTLTQSTRERLCSIIIGIARQNPQKIVTELAEMSYRQFQYREELEYEVSELLQEYSTRSIAAIDIGEVFRRLLKIISTHQLRMMPGFYLLVKAMITIEGVALKLDPQFNMMEHLDPFVRKMIREQYGIHTILRDGGEAAGDLFHLLRDLPTETREILQLVKSGHIKIEFEHKGLDPLIKKIDQVTNRLVFGLVLAALVVGSSIVILSDIPPKIYSLPLIGIVGFLTAGVMAFWLLISILQHEKM